MRSAALFGVVTPFLFASLGSAAILDAATFANTTFDFIVAGGGTAGVAVAVRLSEIPGFTVGIIEAGAYNPEDPKILIPQGWNSGRTWGNPDYDWGFYTTPQKKLANREIGIVRGKVLGGSSALNLLGVFLAGGVEYDQIGQLGNPGWSYKNTLKYFKKATNMIATPNSPRYHGTQGPIRACFSAWFSWAIPPFTEAMAKLGFPEVHPGSEQRDEGTTWNPPLAINPDTQTRSYSAIEYYAPNAGRPNLHLVTGAHVTKIELSPAPGLLGNRRATGVTYLVNGRSYTATTRKEVIVSAGSIQSPQILELSGIGDKKLLQKVGIQSKVDLPGVGENYQDHLVYLQGFTVPHNIDTWDLLADPAQNATAFAQYENNRTGPYTSSITSVGFQSAARAAKNPALLSKWLRELDLQFLASKPTVGQLRMYQIERARLLPNSKEAALEVYAAPSNPYPELFQPNTSYIQVATILLHPFSRGSIHVNSADPLAHPSIDLNAWAFDIDKHLTIQGAKDNRRTVQTKPLSDIIESYVSPGPEVTTDAQWEKHISENTRMPFHPCCTNAMLPRVYGGVVNPRLKVYGTTNIRVVDISILPLNLATHLLGTTYAIAEQAADMIKADYGYN